MSYGYALIKTKPNTTKSCTYVLWDLLYICFASMNLLLLKWKPRHFDRIIVTNRSQWGKIRQSDIFLSVYGI